MVYFYESVDTEWSSKPIRKNGEIYGKRTTIRNRNGHKTKVVDMLNRRGCVIPGKERRGKTRKMRN